MWNVNRFQEEMPGLSDAPPQSTLCVQVNALI